MYENCTTIISKKRNISSIYTNSTKEIRKIPKKIEKRNKYHDKSDLMHFLKKFSTPSRTSTNIEYGRIILRREGIKKFDFILYNNRTFDQKFELLRRIISADRRLFLDNLWEIQN